MKKVRLDVLLTERGLSDSRSQAQALIMAGVVQVNGRVITKAGTQVSADAAVTLEQKSPYASRGALKLEAALDNFRVDPRGLVCADVGASTGGFTDLLLQRGAAKVFAIDVGYGQLAWKLRQDERVMVMERTNARYLTRLPEKVNLATIDVSFISLKLLFPAVVKWLTSPASVIALVKPQFEAGKSQVGKGGVVRDPLVHRRVLAQIVQEAVQLEFCILGLMPSPITGPAGNHEFLAYLGWKTDLPDIDVEEAIQNSLMAIQKVKS